MGALLEIVRQHFDGREWVYTEMPDKTVLSMDVSTSQGRFRCYAQTREQEEQFIYYVVSPLVAPQDKRLTMAELLTRANYGMVIGNFELDFTDGEIRYKASVDVEGATLTDMMVANIVGATIAMMDRYMPAISAVIYSSADPVSALAALDV